MAYCHLTNDERSQIYALLSIGATQKQIAVQLNKSRSTISREISRNSGGRGYRPKQAQEKADARRHVASSERKKMKDELLEVIREKLLLDWSPEQISGWLGRAGVEISHESIYLHVWDDKHQGGTLYTHLRHAGKKYNRRGSGKAGRGCIPNRVDIDERPVAVERKERLGDWEGDTVIGANHQGAILTLVDRKSKLSLIVNLKSKTSEAVNNALSERFDRLLEEYPRFESLEQIVRTITFDNGKEFSAHEAIMQVLGAPCYFAKPYHSWERGLNENTNGLVRQYFPKKIRFDKISANDLHKVETKLNNRPRKCLGYKTPIEVFSKSCEKRGVALRV
ncbi:MAG: IS30 family transposase [Gammaproteobacteria bacterium]